MQLNRNKSEYFSTFDHEKNRDSLEQYRVPADWYTQTPMPPVVQRTHKKAFDLDNHLM